MSKAYSYYRLVITDFTRQGSTVTYANLAEFKVYDNFGNNVARQDGAVHTASSTAPNEGSIEYAFDDNSSTYWHSDWQYAPSTTNWLQVQLPTPVVASYIALMSLWIGYGNDYINAFSLYGSNDGETWDLLIEQSGLKSGWTHGVDRVFYIPVEENKMYYNGVLLQQLPEDVVAKYPNVFIYRWADDGTINFMAAPSGYTWYYYTDGATQQIRITECTYVRYVYDTGLGAWTFKKEHTDNGRWGVNSDVGAVLWCNTTMVYGSATSTTLYMPRCGVYKQTTDKLDYNGVGLPPLPTEHIGTNPYAWVCKNVTSGYYDLLMDTASWYYDSSNSGIKPTASTTQYWYRISIAEAKDATEWTLYKESSSWYSLDADSTAMWSLQDIANGKDSIEPYVGAMSLDNPQIAPVVKYLIRDDGKLYTVQGSSIVEVAGTLNAELFRQYGMDEIPSGEILIGIYNPEVLCWTSSANMPRLTATVQGAPGGTHDIISDDIPIGHASIYGISSIDATAEGAQFLLSFDGGAWMAYTENKWAASGSGMSASELVAVPNSAWNTLINSGVKVMRLKAVLDGVDTVTQVKFNFDNEKPTA